MPIKVSINRYPVGFNCVYLTELTKVKLGKICHSEIIYEFGWMGVTKYETNVPLDAVNWQDLPYFFFRQRACLHLLSQLQNKNSVLVSHGVNPHSELRL